MQDGGAENFLWVVGGDCNDLALRPDPTPKPITIPTPTLPLGGPKVTQGRGGRAAPHRVLVA